MGGWGRQWGRAGRKACPWLLALSEERKRRAPRHSRVGGNPAGDDCGHSGQHRIRSSWGRAWPTASTKPATKCRRRAAPQRSRLLPPPPCQPASPLPPPALIRPMPLRPRLIPQRLPVLPRIPQANDKAYLRCPMAGPAQERGLFGVDTLRAEPYRFGAQRSIFFGFRIPASLGARIRRDMRCNARSQEE